MDKEDFLQLVRTKIAAKEPQDTRAAVPPAGAQQGRAGPPRPAHAAAPRAATGSDTARVAPRMSVKMASVEALEHANAVIAKAAEARRREEREARLAAGRVDDDMADDLAASEAATGEAGGCSPDQLS